MEIRENILKGVGIIVPVRIGVAYVTRAERKVIGAIQGRLGPNVQGYYGVLQPLADGLKRRIKETVRPSKANKGVYIMAPIVVFMMALLGWAVIPIEEGGVYADINVGVIYVLGISSIAVIGRLMAGWGSNSKYARLGGRRAAAQMVSYEVSIGRIIITVIMVCGTRNRSGIVEEQREGTWNIIIRWPRFIMFIIAGLAETNRPPFDLPEAEAELVAGYFVEYSAMGFARFFRGEMANIIRISAMTVIRFMGGWDPMWIGLGVEWIPGRIWMARKVQFVIVIYIWVRATYPRYRYDQLMRIGWKVMRPWALGWVVLYGGIMEGFEIWPKE